MPRTLGHDGDRPGSPPRARSALAALLLVLPFLALSSAVAPAAQAAPFGQLRSYTSTDAHKAVKGVQAACPGTAWTPMLSFGDYVLACVSTVWFDSCAQPSPVHGEALMRPTGRAADDRAVRALPHRSQPGERSHVRALPRRPRRPVRFASLRHASSANDIDRAANSSTGAPLAVRGVQARCGGTSWTKMASFTDDVRACENRVWFDDVSAGDICTAKH